MSDEKLDRLEAKFDMMKDSIASIDKTLALNTQQLAIHIKRSDALEAKIVPIEKHVTAVNGVLKFLGIIGVLGAIAEGVMSVIEYLKGR